LAESPRAVAFAEIGGTLMNKDRTCQRVAFGCLLVVITGFGAAAQVNVTTYHNDNSRTGQNVQETVLTTSNVASSTFGEIFYVPVDGQVYAQPLVLSNVSIGGGTHNVVYVATENDTVYAIDANTGKIYWQKSLLLNGGGPIPQGFNGGMWDNNITPTYGITGTPVIDTTTNKIYVVASTVESGFAYHRLHALDLGTDAETVGPQIIGGSNQGQIFNADYQFSRPALLLQNGHVIIAFGQPCDACTYGWVFSYNASTLQQEAVFCVNPGSKAGTVWMSGDGVAADPSGDLYFATGNGPFDALDEFGDSIMKLGLPANNAFPLLDYFTPNVQNEDDNDDWDLGSGGVLILPDLSSGTHPHLLVQAGKTGTIYLIDRTNMGHWCGSATCTDLDVQEILGSASKIGGLSSNLAGVWGSPAYWNGYVYFPSSNKETGLGGNVSDYLKAYSFNAGGSGVLSSVPTSHTPEKFSWPAPSPTVSSNGNTNGILWVVDNGSWNSSCCSVLHAYDATNLSHELFNGTTAAGAVKFTTPTIANGRVYIGGNGRLTVFGPLSDGPGCTATLACHKYQSVILSQLSISCSNYPTYLSTSTEACTPDTGYPNNVHCGGYVSGPSGILSSSSVTAGVPPGNISGPPSWCNYNYTIGITNYQSQLNAQ